MCTKCQDVLSSVCVHRMFNATGFFCLLETIEKRCMLVCVSVCVWPCWFLRQESVPDSCQSSRLTYEALPSTLVLDPALLSLARQSCNQRT